MDNETVELTARYAAFIGKTSYEWVGQKIESAKKTQDMQEQLKVYDDIVNKLLNEKAEIERIAGEYKAKYEQVTISDEDIEHLQNTIGKLAFLFKNYANLDEALEEDSEENATDLLLGLINKDTLKTMQLLGFNYKSAIGEPLTEVCADFIYKKLGNNANKNNKNNKGKQRR